MAWSGYEMCKRVCRIPALYERDGWSWSSFSPEAAPCTHSVPHTGVGSLSLGPAFPGISQLPAAVFQDKHVEEVRKNKEGKDPGEAETD